MKKRLPKPSIDFQQVENFVDELLMPHKQAQLNSLYGVFKTIETLVRIQPQYSDVFRGLLNQKKRLSNMVNGYQISITDDYETLIEEINDQLDEIEELINEEIEKNIEKHEELIGDLFLLIQQQILTIDMYNVVIDELIYHHFEHYKD